MSNAEKWLKEYSEFGKDVLSFLLTLSKSSVDETNQVQLEKVPEMVKMFKEIPLDVLLRIKEMIADGNPVFGTELDETGEEMVHLYIEDNVMASLLEFVFSKMPMYAGESEVEYMKRMFSTAKTTIIEVNNGITELEERMKNGTEQ